MRALLPAGVSMSQFALRWILMFDAVTCAIPGGKRAEQAADNCRASDLPPLSGEVMAGVRRIYDERFVRWCKIVGRRRARRLVRTAFCTSASAS